VLISTLIALRDECLPWNSAISTQAGCNLWKLHFYIYALPLSASFASAALTSFMWRCMVRDKFAGVSEKHIASILRVKRKPRNKPVRNVFLTSNRCIEPQIQNTLINSSHVLNSTLYLLIDFMFENMYLSQIQKLKFRWEILTAVSINITVFWTDN
jgi:hypothetical protein